MKVSQNAAARPYVDVLLKTAASMPQMSAGEHLKHLGTMAMENANWAVPLASMTATGIATIADRMTAASRKAQSYKTMMDANPHLHEQPTELVQKYFNVLYTTNPDFAKEPTIAASFVQNQIGIGGNPTSPHAGIFEAALKARGGGGMGGPGMQNRPGASMMADLGKTLTGLNESRGREAVLNKERESFMGEKNDLQRMIAEKVKEMRAQSRMYSMGKARERSANTRLDHSQKSMQALSDDAARFQQLLDQHGIPY